MQHFSWDQETQRERNDAYREKFLKKTILRTTHDVINQLHKANKSDRCDLLIENTEKLYFLFRERKFSVKVKEK